MVNEDVTIGELARRTGIQAGTLRMWESRYGYPEPARSSGGQRRYPTGTAELLTQVLTDRAAGLSLPIAIERARRAAATPPKSLYALLRRRGPDLAVHQLAKPALIRLCRAIEDECSSRGQQAVLIGSFQRRKHYLASKHRWVDLARTTATSFVFADFVESDMSQRPMEVPLGTDHPLRREWVIIVQGPHLAACLAAWETPARRSTDAARTFETVWTVDRDIVSQLTTAACTIATMAAPEIAPRLTGITHVAPDVDEFQAVTAVTNRMIAYLAGP